ncbi:MAG: hypothetical protein IJ740_08160 [Ruminococcus sp.]|nr:hypothetical protein [Ruminococcus sp.]
MDDSKRLLEAANRLAEPRLRLIKKRIENGTATLADSAEYSHIMSEILGSELSAEVLGLADREGTATALLRESYRRTNERAAEIQKAADRKRGVGLGAVSAEFPAERVQKFAHSLLDPTVPDETIRRRARAGTENISMSFHDDFIKANAEYRDKAGVKCYIERTGSNCCPWCSEVAGKYEMKDQPEGIFRRHDNCDCVIVYDGKVLRGQVGENGRRNRTWTEDKSRAARIEYAERAPKPMRNTPEQAAELETAILEREKSSRENLPTTINKEYIMSAEYKNKFYGITSDRKTDELICKKSRDMLLHRNNTYYEDMYLFDINDGVVGTQTHSKLTQEVTYNASLNSAIKKYPEYSLISLHNHPESKPPSGDDLASNGKHKYKLGLICCHNGDVYIYQAGDKPFTANLFDATVDKYKKRGYNEYNAYIEALEQFKIDYGIRWEKR